MPMVKICPQCGELNPGTKAECRGCGGAMDTVKPVDPASLPDDARYVGSVRTERDLSATDHSSTRDGIEPPAASVVVTGIEVPFLDLLILLVKLAFAAIPAVIVVAVFWTIVSGILTGLATAGR